jgi:hypothetical protein
MVLINQGSEEAVEAAHSGGRCKPCAGQPPTNEQDASKAGWRCRFKGKERVWEGALVRVR